MYGVYSIKIKNYYVVHLKLIQYCKSTILYFFLKKIFFIKVQLIYNVVLVSGAQQSDSARYIYIYIYYTLIMKKSDVTCKSVVKL